MRGGKRVGAGRPAGSKNRPKPQSPVAVSHAVAKRREDVALLVADGRTADEIAIILRTPAAQLKARFAYELEHGAVLARGQNLMRLREAAKGGSTAAMKQIAVLLDVSGAQNDIAGPAPEPESEADMFHRLGKKEQRLEAAKTAGHGTSWGDDLDAPPTVN